MTLTTIPSSWTHPENWTYVLLSGRPHQQDNFYYTSCYQLWKQVWGQTLSEVDGIESICSDAFTRQDEIGALFSKDRCLMLSGFRIVDFAQPATRDDSYFSPWSDSSIECLKQEGNLVLVGNQITLSPDVRGKDFPVSMKDLIVSLSIARLMDSPCSAMAGTMRSLKGMNTLAMRHGANLIPQELQLHGESSAIFAFYRRTYSQGLPILQELTQKLWQGRIDLVTTKPLPKLRVA